MSSSGLPGCLNRAAPTRARASPAAGSPWERGPGLLSPCSREHRTGPFGTLGHTPAAHPALRWARGHRAGVGRGPWPVDRKSPASLVTNGGRCEGKVQATRQEALTTLFVRTRTHESLSDSAPQDGTSALPPCTSLFSREGLQDAQEVISGAFQAGLRWSTGWTEAHTGPRHCLGTGWLTRWQARPPQVALPGGKEATPVCPAPQVGAAAGLLGAGRGGVASNYTRSTGHFPRAPHVMFSSNTCSGDPGLALVPFRLSLLLVPQTLVSPASVPGLPPPHRAYDPGESHPSSGSTHPCADTSCTSIPSHHLPPELRAHLSRDPPTSVPNLTSHWPPHACSLSEWSQPPLRVIPSPPPATPPLAHFLDPSRPYFSLPASGLGHRHVLSGPGELLSRL